MSSSQNLFDPLHVNAMIHLVPVKLMSTNYLLWKHQLDAMLMCFDVIDFVDGTTPEPMIVAGVTATEIAT